MSDEQEIKIDEFDFDLIRKYPRSGKKLTIAISEYGIRNEPDQKAGQCQFISPHGIEFKTAKDFPHGSLLKIHVALPDYWSRKQKFVDYARVDSPAEFKILAKVVRSEDVGKRGRKKLVTCQTLVMDEVDEQVLKNYLQEG